MIRKKIISKSKAETKNLAVRLAHFLKENDIISLEGQLGAGKTVFVKGLAFGLGIKEPVTSPTFTILKQYNGNIELNHFDAYRINEKEFSDLGYRDFFYSGQVSAIEWGDRIKNLLPDDVLILGFEYADDKNQRVISVEAKGKSWGERVKKWLS